MAKKPSKPVQNRTNAVAAAGDSGETRIGGAMRLPSGDGPRAKNTRIMADIPMSGTVTDKKVAIAPAGSK